MDILTVDAFAGRIVSTSRRPLRAGEERPLGGGGPGHRVPQFLAQEYKHVVLAQDLRTCAEYEAAERKGSGSALPVSARSLVWRTVEESPRGVVDVEAVVLNPGKAFVHTEIDPLARAVSEAALDTERKCGPLSVWPLIE
ncbi:hypothetical protein OG572_06025 [Streptomyces virginiae]|nr:hypothetical protein OG253_06275 [Streptomyces virginiae]